MNSRFEKEEPIIIAGMHRSGTSILTDLVQAMGVFVGNKRGAHNEDQLFVYLNDWILSEWDCSWANPYRLDFGLEKAEGLDLVSTHVEDYLKWTYHLKFFGLRNLLKRQWQGKDFKFSIKDPCFSILGPVWERVFPKAKYLFIIRDGVEVALSLQKRQTSYFLKNQKRYSNNPLFKNYMLYRQHLIRKNRVKAFNSGICNESLDQGIALWDYYNQGIEKFVATQPKEKFLTLRYETLLQAPEENIRQIGAFVFGENISEEKVASIAKMLNLDKRKGPPLTEEITNARTANKSILSKYGY